MIVENCIEGDTYRKLIDYAFQTSDCIIVKKYCDQHECETERKERVVYSYSRFSRDNIIRNYSEQFLKEAVLFFEKNDILFPKEYIDNYEAKYYKTEEEKMFHRRSVITSIFNRIIYNYNIDTWIKKCKKDIVKVEEVYLDNYVKYQIQFYINPKNYIKQMLLEWESIYRMKYPEGVEDLCFLRNGNYWLKSVTHENLCFINCRNKQEYEYLKSIGIIFGEEYTPIEEKDI